MRIIPALLVLLASFAGAQGQSLPQCPVTATLVSPRKSTVIGDTATITATVKNVGAFPIEMLNLEMYLPSNVCFEKSRVVPSLKNTASPQADGQPLIITQDLYWLDFPLGPRKKRKFQVKVRVSPAYTSAASLPVFALFYINGVTSPTCGTSLNSTVREAHSPCGWSGLPETRSAQSCEHHAQTSGGAVISLYADHFMVLCVFQTHPNQPTVF